MKTQIFESAIINRYPVKFLYKLNEIVIEPYFVTYNSKGKKVVYGKVNGSNDIKVFEYENIANIKELKYNRFTPVIPIIPLYN